MENLAVLNREEIKVSIIMPAYNSGEYIKESILCVMNQTHQNWELLIVDDFSSDNTIDVIEEFDDKRIVLFKNTSNNGAAYSRNLGISKATGQYDVKLAITFDYGQKTAEAEIATSEKICKYYNTLLVLCLIFF